MRQTATRQSGSAFLAMMVFFSFLVAVAAALTMLTTTNLKASSRSDDSMRAFYLADSGAQICNSMVRSSDGTLASTSFTEALAGGTVTVEITDLGGGLYQIRCTGTHDNGVSTVEMHVSWETAPISVASGVQMNFGRGVEVDGGGLPVTLNGTSTVSGLDHAADGTVLADQSGAVHGFGNNNLPGGVGISASVAAGATLEGGPTAMSNALPRDANPARNLVRYARDNADVYVSGSTVLGGAATGLYGTAASPALVYVTLSSNQTLTLNANFSGYGTLVIRARTDENAITALAMAVTAEWNGLVVISVRGEEIESESSNSLVEMRDDSKITGALALDINAEELEFEGAGSLFAAFGNASVLYSTELLGVAPGPATASSVKTVSYRMP